RRDGAARRRHVCRQEGRRGRCRGIVWRALASLHAWPPRLDPAAGGDRRGYGRRSQRPAEGDPGLGAGVDQSAAGLLVCAALPVCRRSLPLLLSALRAKTPGALGRLLAFRAALWLATSPPWPLPRRSLAPAITARRCLRSST